MQAEASKSFVDQKQKGEEYMYKKVLVKKSSLKKDIPVLRKKLKRRIKVKYEDFGLFPHMFYKQYPYEQELKDCLEYLVGNNIQPISEENMLDILEFWTHIHPQKLKY